jgi:GNAT superfamily N-acetyltransferase
MFKMISELSKDHFSKCRALLNEVGQIEAKAVIEGINPGRVFVDDLDVPSSGFIWLGNNDGFIFFGNEHNESFNHELDHYFEQVIIPEAKKVGLKWFEGVGNHANWNMTIQNVFGHRKLGSWNQLVYTLVKEDYKGNIELKTNEDYEVMKISSSLLESNTIKNAEFLLKKISEFWSSPSDFLKNGIGYCAIFNHEIVSVCFSGFVVDNFHCIDIETLAAHRGKKLAQRLAHAYVLDCLEHNLVPYWDCMEMNKPSVAVVENLGFQNRFNYVGYEFPLGE